MTSIVDPVRVTAPLPQHAKARAEGPRLASPRSQARTLRKSPMMFVAVIAFFAVCAARLSPRLLHLLDEPTGAAGKAVIVLFIAQLNVFWLFGGYYVMLALFTFVAWLRRSAPPVAMHDGPEVAVLYLTMNDFQAAAATSCLEQDYARFHLYILDDSADPTWRAAVDQFKDVHGAAVSVIRRTSRTGYKAGSINSALRHHVRSCEYFVVADADSVLPRDFVSRLLPYFDIAPEVGWVQASHAPNPVQKSRFADDLALGILPLWEVYYSPRNRYGNVIFLGHGGMIRTDVWKAAGGFPEIVSEDLAFSTRASQLGFRGYYAHDVVSFEDFPQGYRQLRRQQAKYVKGACEYLHLECARYLRSSKATWFEKMDVLMSCGSLLIQPLVLAFMIVFCVAIPLLFGVWQPLTVQLFGHDLLTVPVRLLSDRFSNVWSGEFFVVTSICTVAPVIGCFSVIARYPRRGMRMFLVSAVPYLSLLVVSAVSIISYALSRQAVFLVTGDRLGVDPKSLPTGFSPTSPVAERLGAEDWITHAIEMVLGITLTVICILTFNVSLLAFAIALALSPVLLRVRWEAPLLRPVLYLPYLLIFAGLLLGLTNGITAEGAAMATFFFHF
jgi:cellulose synthase/poly-beta-1,6-N-acetylglucosamine synthase-like glycosyltransferase